MFGAMASGKPPRSEGVRRRKVRRKARVGDLGGRRYTSTTAIFEKWRAVIDSSLIIVEVYDMIRSMNVGDERRYRRTITMEDVKRFGEVSGDMNPAHFDETYAETTIFKKPIVHGMLVGSLFSKVFGLDYPGEGTIYCSQTLVFKKPVYPLTMLEVVVRVKDLMPEKNRVVFTTEVYDEAGDCVLGGEAVLMPKKEKT